MESKPLKIIVFSLLEHLVVSHCNQIRMHAGLITCEPIHPQPTCGWMLIDYLSSFDGSQSHSPSHEKTSEGVNDKILQS